jgi:release factor glutamine methyltransferase
MLSITQTLATLQTQGLDRLDAQLLVLHVLGRPHQRGWLLAHDDDAFLPDCAERLNILTKRRLMGEPLAHLTCHQEFYGIDFHVDKQVLVPRPETETLVDWALEVLPEYSATAHVLDLGTGSGAIALALKATRPRLAVWATDASQAALTVAKANAQRLNISVPFYAGNWFDALPFYAPRFDCIVSNPPYIAENDAHLKALRFEPVQALTSGADGLDDIRHIIRYAKAYMKPDGWLLLEHGYDQSAAVRHFLTTQGFAFVQSRCDLMGIERCSGGKVSKILASDLPDNNF